MSRRHSQYPFSISPRTQGNLFLWLTFFASIVLPFANSFAELPPEIDNALLRGHWADVIRRADDITTTDQVTRLSLARSKALALRELGKETEALALLDKVIKEIPKESKGMSKEKARLNDSLRDWLQLDRAQLLIAQPKKRAQGMTLIEQLSRSTHSEVASVALYLLTSERVASAQIDAAALAFNLGREAYPDAVGEEQLIDLLAGDDDDQERTKGKSVQEQNTPKIKPADESASRITNTRYAIQLGVFATKANADAMLVKVSSKRLTGTIEKKLVSGKSYFAALVGSFLDLTSAQAVRDSLELVHNASFTVITR